MELVGYAEIRKDATTGVSAVSLDLFKGNVVRVYEFAPHGGVLVLDAQATGLAMFDECDVVRKFECSEVGNFLFPLVSIFWSNTFMLQSYSEEKEDGAQFFVRC